MAGKTPLQVGASLFVATEAQVRLQHVIKRRKSLPCPLAAETKLLADS